MASSASLGGSSPSAALPGRTRHRGLLLFPDLPASLSVSPTSLSHFLFCFV